MARTALVVDDSRVARMMLSKLLKVNGFEVVEHASGEDALAHLQSSEHKPNLIFMDVMMKGMDGLTATQHIKSDTALANIPIVICTGNDGEADRDKALAAGAMAVLTKPPSGEALAEILAVLPSQAIVEPASTPDPQAAPAAVIDEAGLIAKIIANIEQTIVPKVQQNVRDTAEDISHQIAEETVERLVEERVKVIIDAQLPAIKEQVSTQAQQATEEIAQQAAKRAARETVGTIAEQAVQRVIAETDFSTQALESLATTGKTWLSHQEQQLQTKLEQTLNRSINQHLESSLTPSVAPIVTDLVNKQLAQQAVSNDVDEQEERIDSLSKKISILSGIVIVFVIAVIAVGAAGAFIFLK